MDEVKPQEEVFVPAKNNLLIYNNVRAVPAEAQKTIGGGRLKGMTDINPMWRIKKLTEVYGPVGIGWYYNILKQWQEAVDNGEIDAFTNIELYYKVKEDVWSKPIMGTGGSLLVAMEKEGLHTNDECYKMALTDAISVACKAIGIGADVYWQKDNTKYTRWDDGQQPTGQPPAGQPPTSQPATEPPKTGQPEKQYGAMATAFKSGKHAGQTIGELAKTKDGIQYLEWYRDNGKNPFMQGKIVEAFAELEKAAIKKAREGLNNRTAEPPVQQAMGNPDPNNGEMPFYNLNPDDEDLPF